MDSQEQQADHGTAIEEIAGSPAGFDEQKARKGARLLIEAIGRDPDEAVIFDTWNRRVPAMLETLTERRRPEAKPALQTFDAETDGLVVKTGIPLYSMCIHHLLPFHGVAHIAYRPGESMVGLSKLVRYVQWQSRCLTTQEALTHDIATGLADELDARGVLVEITATHMCEQMRGVETATDTTTSEAIGTVTEPDREQFHESIRRSNARDGSY